VAGRPRPSRALPTGLCNHHSRALFSVMVMCWRGCFGGVALEFRSANARAQKTFWDHALLVRPTIGTLAQGIMLGAHSRGKVGGACICRGSVRLLTNGSRSSTGNWLVFGLRHLGAGWGWLLKKTEGEIKDARRARLGASGLVGGADFENSARQHLDANR